MAFDARDLDRMLREAFKPHVGEEVVIRIKTSNKSKPADIVGWIAATYPHGVLIQRRWQYDVEHGIHEAVTVGKEFISYVDLYIMQARVVDGDVKHDLDLVLPEIRRDVMLALKGIHRDLGVAVAVGD
ncbi:MAG: hypothetical protein M0Z66_03040 [Thermaerobacter sp.]|nr:hypothetical protein [Thermaerobacter sp.]